MGRFNSEESQRRDFVQALTLWIVAMFIGLLFFPALEVIKPSGAVLKGWFTWSLIYGISGVLLITLSSRWIELVNDRPGAKDSKLLATLLAQVAGWFGLLGILYPLIMACTEFFTKLKV
jgi:hypothetical protein